MGHRTRQGPRGPRKDRSRRDGAAAVEFAMVAAPFFFMLFAILELGLIFVTSSVLENAMYDSARLIRTGQAEQRGIDAAKFKADLCSRMTLFQSDCAGSTTIDVREIPQFRNNTPPDPTSNGETFDSTGLTYLPGEPGSLMLVRVWYEYTLFTPFMSQALSRMDNGKAIMTAATSFRNEPYNQ